MSCLTCKLNMGFNVAVSTYILDFMSLLLMPLYMYSMYSYKISSNGGGVVEWITRPTSNLKDC